MKLLILSDTHGNNINAIKVIDNIKKKIDVVIHLGDCIEDVERLSHQFSNLTFYYVSGNCDFNSTSPHEQILSFNRIKILITHGHRYSVKWGYEKISYVAKEKGTQAVLFGHTHIPSIDYINSILVMNPGSISKPRSTSIPSYGIVDITDNGVINPSIVGIFGKDDYRIMF